MLTAIDLLNHLAGAVNPPNLQHMAAEAPYRRFAAAVASDLNSARFLSAIDFIAGHTLRALGARMPEAAPPPLQPSEIAALAAAVELAARADLKRAEAEARLLADQSAQDIADCLKVGPETIDAYEQYFFDIRVRRSDPRWISEWVLPLQPGFVLQRHDVALLWKIIADQYGGAVLDQMIRSVSRGKLARQGVDSYVKTEVDLPLTLKIWIAGQRIPNPQTLKGLQMYENFLLMKMMISEAIHDGTDFAPALSRIVKSEQTLPMEECLLRFFMLAVRKIK